MIPRQSPRARKYRISQDDLEILELHQGGLCAICGEPFVGTPHIDHVHDEARRVRGLLCLRCNTGISLLRENPEVLWRAIDYLGGLPAAVGTA
jgi:5-methylcytosine-specific restriction endonuclease McrA